MNTLLPISPTNRRGPIPSLARIATVLTLGFAAQVQAADYTWLGGAGGTWATADNYAVPQPPSGGPTASDNLTVSGTYTINLTGLSAQINNLTSAVANGDISGGGNPGGTLIVYGDLTVDTGASLSLRNGNSYPGNFDIRGDVSIAAGSTMNLGSTHPTQNNSSLNSFQVSSTSSITVSGNLYIQKQPGNALLGDLIVNNGAMVNLGRTGSNNQDITKTINARSLSGSGEIVVNGVATSGGTGTATLLVTTANTTNANFSGVLGNGASAGQSLALTIAGSGTQTLSGANTYTGATLVSAGTLLIDGSLGATEVTVGADGILGGNGTIAGGLHLDSGADFVFSLTDTLTVNGAEVTFDGFGVVNLFGLNSSVADGVYTLINGSATFDFTNVTNFGIDNAYDLGGNKLAYFQEGSLQLVVSTIPEPGSTALLLFGGLGLLAVRSRRRYARLPVQG